ncbi:hypothetical protein WJX74_008948 [Apatococcus lobatus]|uniref:F-box domain-containing protein n=1 Tax=Apatococcus lobatus TaxID=904363 RepID=A0AAW1RRN1_9CHLO
MAARIPHPRLVAEDILFSGDILHVILERLTLPDALRLAASCSTIRNLVKDFRGQSGVFQPRLIVCSSKNNQVVELDWFSGETVATGSTMPPRKPAPPFARRRPRSEGCWSTGLAFSPYDHHLYVCQYKVNGIVQLHGRTLRYKKVFARSIPAPEGIVFSQNGMYVVSAEGDLHFMHLDGGRKMGGWSRSIRWGPPWSPFIDVPWGLAIGPPHEGRKLYITMANEYASKLYTDPPLVGDTDQLVVQGKLLIAKLSGPGKSPMGEEVITYKETSLSMVRPSGLCFTPGGDLLVTSMDRKIYQHVRQGHAGPSEFANIRPLTLDRDLGGLPWDLKMYGKHLLVTVHSGNKSKACIMQFQLDEGAGKAFFEREICSAKFQHPNMFLLEP